MSYYWRIDNECPTNGTATLKNNILTIDCEDVHKRVKGKYYKLGFKQYLYTYNGPTFINKTEVVSAFCDFIFSRKLVQNLEKPQVAKLQTQIYMIKDGEKPEKRERLSINVLMMDGMSRPQFMRALKKTRAFLEEVHEHRDEFGFEVFQFMHYHVLGRGSISNLSPMLSGKSLQTDYTRSWGSSNANYSEFVHGSWLWKQAKRKGYVTLLSDEQCGMRRHLLPWMSPPIDGGVDQVYPYVHHRFGGIFCEAPDAQYGSRKRCVSGELAHKHVFNYLNSFFSNYRNSPKFAWNFMYEAHEPTYSILPLMDEDLTQFLKESVQDKTRVTVIVSDHGLHYGPYTFKPYPGALEHRLPTLLMLFPDHFLKRHPEVEQSLKEKEQTIITAPEIYSMLLHLIHWPNKPMGDVPNDLVNHLTPGSLPEYRSCDEAKIPSQFCVCNSEWWLNAEGEAAYGDS